jgi:hypothetical protein
MDRPALVEINTGGVFRDAGGALGERFGSALAFADSDGMGWGIGVYILFGHDGSPYLMVTS